MPCDDGHYSRRWAARLYTCRHSTRHLLCSISNRARLLGLERTSSTISQTRGPAWREAIVSNLMDMQRPHSRGVYGRIYADCGHGPGPFGLSGLVWRAGSNVSRSAEVWDCAEVEVPTFRERLIEQRCPWKGQFSPRDRLAGAECRRVCLHQHITTRTTLEQSNT